MKSILIEARGEPAVAVEASRRNTETAAAAAADFAALGVADPAVSARLFVALVAEVALMEVESGGVDDRARAALVDFLPTIARRPEPRPPRRERSTCGPNLLAVVVATACEPRAWRSV